MTPIHIASVFVSGIAPALSLTQAAGYVRLKAERQAVTEVAEGHW